jgi:hypothetical protein
MSLLPLHVLHAEPSADFGELRLASQPGEGGSRWIVWDGLPPPAAGSSPFVAPVALSGEIDGKLAYAELVPRGVRLSDTALPAALSPFVAAGVVEAVEALHDLGLTHGRIDADRVLLGSDGRVVLFGRGRRPAHPDDDHAALLALLASLGIRAPDATLRAVREALSGGSAPEDREALAAFVAVQLPTPTPPLAVLHLRTGPSDDSLDEILPDIGSDPVEERGLLDPQTSPSGTGDPEPTAELTLGSAQAGGAPPMALSLWTRLAAPPRHTPPPDRFRECAHLPFEGLRALLLAEGPEAVPTLIGGDVGPFLTLGADAEPSGAWPPALVDGETTPGPGDGDTAIDGLRPRERSVDDATTDARFAALEARLAAAERRDRPGAPSPWSGFFRVEVVIAAILGALVTWLLSRAFG